MDTQTDAQTWAKS